MSNDADSGLGRSTQHGLGFRTELRLRTGANLVETWPDVGYPASSVLDHVNPAMTQQALFQNIHRTDPLEFWSNHGLDYRKVSDFLDLDTEELSKIGGVSKRSVRLDSRIPHDLAARLEQIANICAIVAGYFEGDIDKTALWFRTPNSMLGDISPRDMIRFGRYKRLLKFVMEARDANPSSAA